MIQKKISDKKRFSIMQEDMTYCYICRRYPTDIHEIYNGTANRNKSKLYGLCIGLCRKHHAEAHENGDLMKFLKQEGQRAFENKYDREKFISIFGKNYLKDFEK